MGYKSLTAPVAQTAASDATFLDQLTDSAWSAASTLGGGALSILSGAGTVLGTLGRPVKTILATGSPGQALRSIFDPEAASSARDLLGTLGIPAASRRPGEVDAGDFIDFPLEMAIEMGTDPVSWLAPGATSAGKALSKAGTKAFHLLRKTGDADGAALLFSKTFEKTIGKTITKEAALARVRNLGAGATLSERLATGETGIGLSFSGFGKPFAETTLKPLAPMAEKAGIAFRLLGDTLAGHAKKTKTGTVILDALTTARGFMSAKTGIRGLDAVIDLRENPMEMIAPLLKPVEAARQAAKAAGLSNEELKAATRLVENMLPWEHLSRLAKITGQNEEDILMLAGKSGRANIDIIRDALGGAPNDLKETALRGLANAISDSMSGIAHLEESAGGQTNTLSQLMNKVVRERKRELDDVMTGLGERPNQVGLAVIEAARKRLDDAVQNSAALPSYMPHVVSDEAALMLLKAERDTPPGAPSLIRTMLDYSGKPLTADAANKLIQALGVTATAGRSIKGAVGLLDAAKIWRGATKDLKGAARELADLVESKGAFFGENPFHLVAERVDRTARFMSTRQITDDVVRGFGSPLPKDLLDLRRQLAKAKQMIKIADTETGKELIEQRVKDLTGRIEAWHAPKGTILASRVPGLRMAKGQDALLPHNVAVQLDRQASMMADPLVWKGLLAPVRRTAAIWKSFQVMNPRFFITNEIGNNLLAAQRGAYNPLNPASIVGWVKAKAEVLKLQRMASKTGQSLGGAERLGQTIIDLGGGRSMPAEEFVTTLHRNGVTDSGFFGVEMGDLRTELSPKTPLGRIADTTRAWNQALENNTKGAFVLARLRQGDDMEQAMLAANEATFNYRNVSKGIQLLRSTGIAPFVAWQAKNIPFQLGMLAERPGQFLSLMHAKDVLEQGMPGLTPEQASDMSERWGIRTRQNKDGSYDFITVQGVVPAADVVAFSRAFAGVEDMSRFLADIVGPVKIPFEVIMFNRNLMTKRDIERFDGEHSLIDVLPGVKIPVPAKLAYAARQIGGRIPQLYEAGIRLINGEIDPDTGKPVDFMHSPLFGGLSPFRPSRVNTPFDVKMQLGALDSQIGAAKRALSTAYKVGGSGQGRAMSVHLNAVRALMKRREQMVKGHTRSLQPVP